MASESQDSGRLRIRRLEVNCLVAADHPSPAQVSRRLAEVADKSLPRAVAASLAGAFPASDRSLWFIRRIELAVDVNLAWDSARLSQSLGAGAARALAAELGTHGDGLNVIRFESPAQFLAMFLIDLMEGCAWGKWYYDAFEGLRMLPVSNALRTSICDDVAAGLAALNHLDRPTLGRLIGRLTEADAGRILGELTNGSEEVDESCYQQVEYALHKVTRATLEELDDSKAGLLLLAQASRDAAAAGGSLAAAAQMIIRLIRSRAQLSPLNRRHLDRALRSRDPVLLRQAVGEAAAERLGRLFALSEGALVPILNFVQEKQEIAATAGATASPRHTGFGGVFLLLPLLDELPLAEATRDWPDAAGIPPSALVRWLILVKCLGAGRPAAAARDPLIQELSGLPSSTLSATLLGDWQRRVSVKKVEAFLLVLARWRRETGSAAGRVWIVAPVKTNRREASLLMDVARGCCLFAVPEAPPRLNLLARTLAALRAARAGAPVAVLCGPAYRAAVEKADPEITVLDADDRAAIEQCGFAEAVTPALSGLPATGDAFDFFALPRQFRLSPACDLALSIAAQGLLRDFAWRLPGFAWSQPAYVRENFLDCEAVIEDEEDRCVVRLTRPPLNLLLNMTGLNRRRYKLSWSEGRSFELYPDGA